MLPDEIWITDQEALDLVNKLFPNVEKKLLSNAYVDDQVRNIKGLLPNPQKELLYILEPMRDDWGRDIPGEFQALDFFCSNLNKLEVNQRTEIVLRLHPSEEIYKYDEWISRHLNLNISLTTSMEPISKSIGTATWVVGCESYALYLAYLAGKDVICSLPPWAPKCRLPARCFSHMRGMV